MKAFEDLLNFSKNLNLTSELFQDLCGAVFWLLICFQKKPHIYQLLAMRENSAHRKGNRRTQKSIIIRGHHFLQSYILLPYEKKFTKLV